MGDSRAHPAPRRTFYPGSDARIPGRSRRTGWLAAHYLEAILAQEQERRMAPAGPVAREECAGNPQERYLGDRNFDLMLMGSASKPIFAAAALAAHPGLDKRLHTIGGEDRVNDLFGARVADVPWNESWHGGPGPWRNFDNYLAYSDNRYTSD